MIFFAESKYHFLWSKGKYGVELGLYRDEQYQILVKYAYLCINYYFWAHPDEFVVGSGDVRVRGVTNKCHTAPGARIFLIVSIHHDRVYRVLTLLRLINYT